MSLAYQTVQILYWDRGMLLSTPRGGHAGAVQHDE